MIRRILGPLRAQTIWVTIACLAGAAAGIGLLYLDLRGGPLGSRGKQIAVLEKREANVRRKASSSYVWQSVEEKAELFEKESIQTGAGAAALIRLENGTEVQLGENSLIVLDEVKDLALSFVKGTAIVHDSSGTKEISVDKGGQTRVARIAARLLRPAALSEFFVAAGAAGPASERKQVSFEWAFAEGQAAPEDYRVEVSPLRTFPADRVRAFRVSPRGLSAEAALPPGKYFWRLHSKDGPLSEARPLKVTAIGALRPVWPVQQSKVRLFEASSEASSVQFRWTAPPEAARARDARHQLQVAATADFRTLLAEQPIAAEAGAATLGKLAPGRLYWRVVSRYKDVTLQSETQQFQLEKAATIACAQSYPAEGASFALQAGIRFTWSCEAPGLRYAWELQDSSGNIVHSTRAVASSALWDQPRSGSYRWRVAALSGDRRVSETPWRSLLVSAGRPLELLSPAPGESFVFWKPLESAQLRWKKDELTAGGDFAEELQLARDPGFQQGVTSLKAEAPQISFARAGVSADPAASGPARWFWRVRVLDRGGKPVKVSDTRSFVYGYHPRLQAPEPAPAARDAVFNLRDDAGAPLLRWTEVAQAKGYEVTITPLGGRTPASALRKELKGPKETQLHVGALPPGKYEWTVRALDPGERPGEPAASSRFEITLGKPLRAPRVLATEVQ